MSGVSVSALCDGPVALKVLGEKGYDGWSPKISAASSGSQRFLRVDDWTGGTGVKPAIGYIGASGIVSSIGDAKDFGPSVFSRLDLSAPALTASFRDDGAGNLGWYVGAAGAADGAQVKVATVDKTTGAAAFTQVHSGSASPQMGSATASFSNGAFVHATNGAYWQTHESGQGPDAKNWRIGAISGSLVLQALNDAYSGVIAAPMCVSRGGQFGVNTLTPAGSLHVALTTTPSWGGPWGTWSAAFGGFGPVNGALGLSFNDTDGGEIGSVVPGVSWKPLTLRGSGIMFKPDGVNESLRIDPAGTTRPGADNAFSLGGPSFRWSVVYAATGTINTSDAREKLDRDGAEITAETNWKVSPLTEAELRVARRLASEIGVYIWKDAAEKKGVDGARRHIGLTVQRGLHICEEEGVDPWSLSIFCRDDIARKVKVTHTETLQSTEDVEETYSEIEVRDGVPVRVQKTRTVQRPKVEMVAVVDEAGDPVVQGDQPMLHPVPVMIEVEREVWIEEPAGERLGFRYDQLTLFMMRGLVDAVS